MIGRSRIYRERPLFFIVPNWITDNQTLFWILGIASAVIFVGSLLIVPALIVRIPSHYFTHERRPPGRWAARQPVARWGLTIGKNLVGVLLLLGGVAMLVLPGQGLLTLFAGFVLIDFPRKYALERWLVRRRCVNRPINWMRRKRGREPLTTYDPQRDANTEC